MKYLNIWTKAGLAVAGGGAIAASMFGLPAVGQQSPPGGPLILGTTGQLFNRGVGAHVPVKAVCTAGDQGSVFVSLNERSGKSIAQGSGYQNFNCTGGIQSIVVDVLAGSNQYGGSSSSAPFVKGTAYGQASLNDCAPQFYCNQTGTDDENVQLSNK